MNSSIIVVVLAGVGAGCNHSSDAFAGRGAAPSVRVKVGVQPAELAAGDLDGDGRIDLVSLNGDGTLSVRLQRGGTWKPAPGDPVVVADSPHMIALADLDLDRDLDIVLTGHDSGAVHVLAGDGAGRFAPVKGSPFVAVTAAKPHNHGLVVGDVDGDGDPDVVVADQEQRAAVVLLGDGTGALAVAAGSPIELGGQSYPPRLGDLDGDRVLDLVVPLVGAQAIAVLLGDGAGGFRHAKGSPMKTGPVRPYGIALGDLDRDGALDVIATHDDTDEISVLLGDGHGALRAAPGSPVDLGLRIGTGPLTADIDGDGVLDLVGAGSGSLVVAAGDGRGGFGRPRRERLREGWRVIAADLDGDARVDLAAPEPTAGVIRVWLTPAP